MVGGELSLKILAPTPLTFGDRQCLEDSERKDYLNRLSVNHKGLYRTALATPGLLNIFIIYVFFVDILHVRFNT